MNASWRSRPLGRRELAVVDDGFDAGVAQRRVHLLGCLDGRGVDEPGAVARGDER
jgi:hypothetical protein